MGDLREFSALGETDIVNDLVALQSETLLNTRRITKGWLDGPTPLINPHAIETDEALAQTVKCYLDNAIMYLNEATRRGLKVTVELDTQHTNHAGGGTSKKYLLTEFTISKDLLK